MGHGMEHILPPRDLWVNGGEPFVTYTRWIWEFRVYLTMLCDLRVDDAVLEIGCNHGRTMLALLEYLQEGARYEGFDIDPPTVAYASQHLGSDRFPVAFRCFDIHNSLYNPNGKERVETFRFPYEDGEFDVAFAGSVFTHMTRKGVANYFGETGRVLRPGGRALFSVFVHDNYRGPGTPTSPDYHFDHRFEDEEDCYVTDPARPELFVAYTEASLRDLVQRAGLRVRRIVHGVWSRSHDIGVCEQDLLVLEKPDA